MLDPLAIRRIHRLVEDAAASLSAVISHTADDELGELADSAHGHLVAARADLGGALGRLAALQKP